VQRRERLLEAPLVERRQAQGVLQLPFEGPVPGLAGQLQGGAEAVACVVRPAQVAVELPSVEEGVRPPAEVAARAPEGDRAVEMGTRASS
jgi:hypothetical protein